MKNKRYFCDWCDKHPKLPGIIIVVLFVIFVGIEILVVENEYKSKLEEGYYVYNEEGYKQLEKVIDNCIYEDGMINIKELLQATDTKINLYEGNFTIICDSKEKNTQEYDYTPSVSVTISNDFTTVSKERMHPTEEDYLKGIKASIYVNTSLMFALMYIAAICLTVGITMSSHAISKLRKTQDSL